MKEQALALIADMSYMEKMDRQTAISRLRVHEVELRRMGVASLSLFGSVARGEAREDSDVDVAATFDPAARLDLFDFGQISAYLHDWLQASVDLVSEPARKRKLQAEIDRDRVRVF